MRENSITFLQKKYGFRKDYLFFLSTIQPRKNIERLIDAFAIVIKKHPELDLVLVGRKGWLFESIINRPKQLGLEKHVYFLDFVDDIDANVLYAHAKCFVFPTLYEGFGLPLLEAMRAGTPVITSNISSLPEIGGDAALYCDPLSIEDIADKINIILSDKKLAAELVKKGKEQVRKFSWEKTARETLAVFDELVKNK